MNKKKKIGVIGAMEEEVEALRVKLENPEKLTKASMDFYSGTMNGHEVVIVRSGIGKVNAGICTQILADLFQVDVVINTGIAGSLRAEINIGDIVISTDAVQHDMDATGFGYKPGVIPRMETSCFKADPDLVAAAKEACAKAVPEVRAFTGRVVSGDQFISDRAVKNRISQQFGGMCTEMEGAAIAQAAPAQAEENLADDGELVAVIAAAIAAAEGTTTDGFVVRSIRKVKRNRR